MSMLEGLDKKPMGILGKPAYEPATKGMKDYEEYGDVIIVVPGNGNEVTVTDNESNSNQTNISGNNNGSINQTNSKTVIRNYRNGMW